MARQRRIRALNLATLTILVIMTAVTGVQIGQAATSSNLSVTSSGTVFTASRNNTLTIEISNVGKYLKELDIALAIPPPLVLFGDNHWIRSSFSPGESIEANLTVFAPSSAAGVTLQGSVVATYKVAGETTQSTETHAISFLIRGWIDLKVYEIIVEPDPVLPGQEITISGSILNRGVIAAMYANVTIDPDQTFSEGSVKPTYVGQIDPNAPAPFSVTAVVDPALSEGPHEAKISVYFKDDVQADHAIQIPISFTVVSELPTTETTRTSITSDLLSNQFVMLGLLAAIILVMIGVFLRRKRERADSN
jgi:uncharacterized membrane protein